MCVVSVNDGVSCTFGFGVVVRGVVADGCGGVADGCGGVADGCGVAAGCGGVADCGEGAGFVAGFAAASVGSLALDGC